MATRALCFVFWFVLLLIPALAPRLAIDRLRVKAETPSNTPVTGDIISDTTWNQAGSPYLASGLLRLRAGVTLTIEPGVEVRFANGARFDVLGTLLAQGSTTQPISFTAVTHTPGSWQGIQLAGTPDNPVLGAVFDHVVIEYGGLAIAHGAGLHLEYAAATVQNSTIRFSAGHGLYAKLRGLTTLTDVNFTDNGGDAVFLEELRVDPVLSALSASGNGVNGVVVGGAGGALTGVHTWDYTGVPYVIPSLLNVDQAGVLDIKPGVEMQFEPGGHLLIAGRINALGEPTAPITFTATDKTPGSWQGIRLLGSQQRAVGTFTYATIEYGGKGDDGANIFAQSGQVSIEHSIIRHGGASGVYLWSDTSGSVIFSSQLLDHPNFAIFNLATTAGSTVLAHYNWWGDPSGPTTSSSCNPAGHGSKISAGVAFLPFLTSADSQVPVIAPPDARLLTLTPARWFAPGNGTSPVNVKITLRDGNGAPLPGRRVRLTTTLGSVVDGGLTDLQGQTSAIVRSGKAGDATLEAVLDLATTCEFARSNTAVITFTDENPDDLFAGSSAAPYLTNDIEISPMPVTRGRPTVVRARLTNNNPFTLTVDATFNIAQAGIGLAFGPIGEVSNVTIPPNSVVMIEKPWLPAFEGHFCVLLEYSVHGLSAELATVHAPGRQLKNFDARPGPFLDENKKDALTKAKHYSDYIDDADFIRGSLEKVDEVHRFAMIPASVLQDQMVGNILDFNFEVGGSSICALQGGRNCGGWKGPRLKIPIIGSIGNLMEDPPSPQYEQLVVLEPLTVEALQPGPDLPAARAAALSDLATAGLKLTNNLFGAAVSHDRYGGAVDAGNTEWMGLQAGAYLYYLFETGKAFNEVAAKLDDLATELRAEGFVSLTVSADDYRAYQDRLRTTGFTPIEIEAAHLIGLTDEGIEGLRQDRLARDPEAVAGDVFADWAAAAAAYRAAGRALLSPPAYGGASGGSPGLEAIEAEPEHQLVRLFAMPFTVPVGNPLNAPATIELRARAIDLPADWAVYINPTSANLPPGGTFTATVTLIPGAAVVQGTLPRVAIEGYAGDQLIGGLVLGAGAPQQHIFDGHLDLFLPSVNKSQAQ
jgi:hypothetical protein